MIRPGARVHPVLVVTTLTLAACRAASPALVSLTGAIGHTVSVGVGDEIRITLQTVGPGEYSNPPAVSSPAVRFLDVSLVAPYVPAGPTQRFRFRADERGQAVITFRHSGIDPTVEDTVIVR